MKPPTAITAIDAPLADVMATLKRRHRDLVEVDERDWHITVADGRYTLFPLDASRTEVELELRAAGGPLHRRSLARAGQRSLDTFAAQMTRFGAKAA